MNLENFINDLSSEKPAPGGGAASAMFGVIALALSSMVCALTKGKKAYEDYQNFVSEKHDEILKLQNQLVDKIQEDKDAYLAVNSAYKLPRETEEQIAFRNKSIQDSLRPAASTPLEIMRLCVAGLELTDSLIGKTTKMAVSDLGCAAQGFKAALNSAWLNVKINLSCSKIPMEDIQSEAKILIEKGNTIADAIYTQVESNL